MVPKNIAILGASRGLGKALAKKVVSSAKELLLISRKEVLLAQLQKEFSPASVKIFSADFSQTKDQAETIKNLKNFQPQIIFYCAGGGPYGNFETKEIKDHHWAFEVNFLFPASLLHAALKNEFQSLEQIVFIGSAIAEDKPDPQSASYSAAKHALRGLISSVQKENRSQTLQIHLYSPSYMDTGLLPKNATPRKQAKVENVDDVADTLLKLSALGRTNDKPR